MSEAATSGESAAPLDKDKTKGRTFNLTSCCVNSCASGFVVLILLIAIPGGWQDRLQQQEIALTKTAKEVSSASPVTVISEAEEVDTRELAGDPERFLGSWLIVSGRLASPESAESAWGSTLKLSHTEYRLDPGITVFDLSARPQLGQEGDEVVAVGKIVVLDLGKIPFTDKRWVDVFGVEGPITHPSIFLLSKDVSLALVKAGGSGLEER